MLDGLAQLFLETVCLYWLVLYHLKCIFCDKYTGGLRSLTSPFQKQTCNAVYYSTQCNLHLVGPVIH